MAQFVTRAGDSTTGQKKVSSASGEFSFRYYEELAANALLPSFAGALTGVLVNVAGRGFDAGTAYTCMWTTQRLVYCLLY